MTKIIFNLNSKLNLATVLLLLATFSGLDSFGQLSACGFTAGDGCANTNYDNSFMKSNSDASTIEYDNFVSLYHSSAIRTFDGSFQIWGEDAANNGTGNLLSPTNITSANFPALGSARVFKVTGGSQGGGTGQWIALASDGLYVWGDEGQVLDGSITTSSTFQKITIAGVADGLPSGVDPVDVKMIVATVNGDRNEGTLLLVTCSGDVWVISESGLLRGNGNTGNDTNWYRVTTNQAGNPNLDNVVAARLSGQGAIALKSDGTLWTWGFDTYLGNNSARSDRNRATQMTLPSAETIKMIGTTTDESDERISYYVLMTNGNLYSLGWNGDRQLGDFTTTERRSWVQPRYASGGGAANVMDDIVWVSPSENDGRYAAVNVINSDSTLYAFGYSSNHMLGLGSDVAANPAIPSGITAATLVTSVNTGGHTSMITVKCEPNFGYVGHRSGGSMGNGSATDSYIASYTFATAPVSVCGTDASTLEVPSGDITGFNGLLCVSGIYNVNTSIGGGTLTATGPVTVTGNPASGYQIQFTSPGSSTLSYQLPANECGILPPPVTLDIEAESCDGDLAVAKTANTLTPAVGGSIIFTITVTNNGPNNATGIVVNDLLPSGYSYVSDNGGGAYNSGTGVWTVGNIAFGTPSVSLQITAAVLPSGNYTNTATVTGIENDPITSNNTAQVTPTPICIDPVLGGANSVCQGQSANVTPSSGGTWSSSNTGVATVTNSGVVSGVSSGTVTLTFTLSSTGCSSTKTFTVNANPTLGGATTVCVGQTSNVTPSSGGFWSSSNTGRATVTNSGVVTGMGAGTATLTFTQSSTGCTNTRTITVNPTPSLGGATAVCVGQTANVTPSSGGTWSSSNTGRATVSNSGVVTGVSGGTVTLTYTQSSTGCTNTRTITVNPTPSLGGATAVCVGETANVTPSSGGTWSSSNNGRATVSNSGVVSGVSAGTVTLTYTQSSTGCTNTRTVTVNPTPSLGGTTAVCIGETANVTPSSGGTWSSSNNGRATVTNSGVVTGVSAGTVTLTYTQSSTGCTNTRTIVVNSNPSLGGATEVCEGLTASVTPNSGGAWSSSNNGVATVTNSGIVSGVSSGTVTLTFTQSSTGCQSTRSFTVNPIPSAPIVGTVTQPTCTNPTGSVVLSGLPSGSWTITRTPGNVSTTGSTSSTTITGLAPNVTYTFTVSSLGCTSSSSSNVVINTIPSIPTLGGPNTVCVGATITVTPTSGGTWSSNNGNVTITNAGLVTGVTAGNSTLTYTETSTGCINTKVVTVVGALLAPSITCD